MNREKKTPKNASYGYKVIVVGIIIIVSYVIINNFINKDESIYIQVTGEEARQIIADHPENYVIIDVRTLDEYQENRIPGSILIPHDEILDKIEFIIPDKDTHIILYCRNGTRTKEAARILQKLGYKYIYDLGGIENW